MEVNQLYFVPLAVFVGLDCGNHVRVPNIKNNSRKLHSFTQPTIVMSQQVLQCPNLKGINMIGQVISTF